MRFALLVLASLCALIYPATAANNTCPLTKVDTYNYYCNTRGTIQAPRRLGAVSIQPTLTKCYALCQSNLACKSYRYIAKTKQCQLYSRYLSDMSFDNYFQSSGYVSDRNCMSTDCNVIKACQAVARCDEAEYDHAPPGDEGIFRSASYKRYACSYGRTAKTLGLTFAETKIRGRNITACDAVRQCVQSTVQGSYKPGRYSLYNPKRIGDTGTIDVHYNILEKVWVCRTYADVDYVPSNYPKGEQDGIYAIYDGYGYTGESATHDRYTVINASVGAGYGYWKSSFSSIADSY